MGRDRGVLLLSICCTGFPGDREGAMTWQLHISQLTARPRGGFFGGTMPEYELRITIPSREMGESQRAAFGARAPGDREDDRGRTNCFFRGHGQHERPARLRARKEQNRKSKKLSD